MSSLQALLDAQEGKSTRTRTRYESDHGRRWTGGGGRRQYHETYERGSRSGRPAGGSRPGGSSSWAQPRREPTYEERRQKIEREAVNGSLHSRHNAQNQIHNDDISTWVGPLGVDGKCVYYQDREKVYKFYCHEKGYNLLQDLMASNRALLSLNEDQVAEESRRATEEGKSSFTPDVIRRIGQGLYSDKPTLRTKGVTWSTAEYAHPGLEWMYLRMKSLQRFTEIYSLLERCKSRGVFNHILERGNSSLRIASVGGGPGYELLATKLFFQEHAPGVELDLISTDVCAAWKPYVELLGFRFEQYDLMDRERSLMDAIGHRTGEVDFCIVSCVMIYVTNSHTLENFSRLIHNDKVKAILLSERGEKMKAANMFEELGGAVTRLIDQSYGKDERQVVFSSKKFKDTRLTKDNESLFEPTFPNVPYEEQKHKGRNWR